MSEPSSPASVHVRAPRLPDWVRRSKLALVALILAVLPFVCYGACAVGALDAKRDEAGGLWLLTCLLAVIGAVLGVVSLVRLSRADRVSGKRVSVLALALGIVSPVLTFFLGLATLDINFGHGRALRRRGKALIPRHVDVDRGALHAHAPIDAPIEAAAAWRNSGATEAGSVLAFAHLAEDLTALGAPAALIARAHANARDEVAHARLCYSLAAAMDGQRLGPGALAVPGLAVPHDLALFARDNIVESCLFEGAAAHVARTLTMRTDLHEAVRATLATIAVDEAKHAAHGWAIVAWCQATAGERVLDECWRALERIDSSRVMTSSPDGLERFGVAGPLVWRAALDRVRAQSFLRLRKSAPLKRSSTTTSWR